VLRLLYLAAVQLTVCLAIHSQAVLDEFGSPRPRDCPVQHLLGANGFAVGARSLGWRGLCAVHALSGSTLDGVLSRRRIVGPVGRATRTDRLCAVPETRPRLTLPMSVTSRLQLSIPARARPVPGESRRLAHVRQARLRRRGAIFSSILHGATLPAEGRRRRDGLDRWPAKGPRRPPGPGPPRTLPARSSPGLSSAPAQDAVERPATDSTPGLDPRARSRGDPDTFGRCGHLDHLSDHRDASLARLVSPTAGA
jgi:hypothetical protein